VWDFILTEENPPIAHRDYAGRGGIAPEAGVGSALLGESENTWRCAACERFWPGNGNRQ